MKNQYTLPFHQCDLIKGTSQDKGWHKEALILLKYKVLDVKIDDDGEVTLTYCNEENQDGKEGEMGVVVTILKCKAPTICTKLQ